MGSACADVRHRISVDEAERLVLECMPRWPAVRVALADAVGCVLRETIVAERDQPPFDRVTMDGIAISSRAWLAGRREFRVTGTQGAGTAALSLGGEERCVEVMTGGVLPSGADTIVPVERTRRTGDQVSVQHVYEARAGQFIHRRGSDHRRGAALLDPGTVIGAPEAAILTIGGHAEVEVTRPPRIAVASTGNELVDAGQPIADFQIRASNDRAIAAALQRRGFSHVSRVTLRDDPDLLRGEIARLHEASDLLILSGGVSMGQFDHVPATLVELGVTAVFHKVTQRPGMPMWFGRDAAGKAVFALPGNPVSSLVCLVRYVLPGIEAAMGATPGPIMRVPLGAAVDVMADLTHFLAVRLAWADDGTVTASPKPTNTSGDFVSLRGTDGCVELPRGRDRFPAGFAAKFFRW
jgi:molybdopterin molybdotransferase